MTIPTAILLMSVGKISATTMVSTGNMPRDAEAYSLAGYSARHHASQHHEAARPFYLHADGKR